MAAKAVRNTHIFFVSYRDSEDCDVTNDVNVVCVPTSVSTTITLNSMLLLLLLLLLLSRNY